MGIHWYILEEDACDKEDREGEITHDRHELVGRRLEWRREHLKGEKEHGRDGGIRQLLDGALPKGDENTDEDDSAHHLDDLPE